MARQLVFTSAPQGLTPGRTGFCTVARHADLRERLVPLIEGLSVYPSGWQPPPVICSFRLLDRGGARVAVLSRIVEAGHDYTHRTNFLAHHLILDPEEIATAPTPADIFTRWTGWLNRWDVAPRWLTDADFINLAALPPAAQPPLPADAWARLTGDAGRAALLLDGSSPATRTLRCPPGDETDLLALFRESSALLDPAEAWRAEFTTCIQVTDTGAPFRWTGQRAGSMADAPAARPASVLDLTQPAGLPPAPVNTAAGRARESVNPFALGTRHSAGQQSRRTAAPPPKAAFQKSVSASRPLASAKSPASLVGLAAILVALLVAGLGVLAWMWWRQSPPPVATTPPPPPVALPIVDVSPQSNQPLVPSGDALANQQILQDIERFADSGQFLDALNRWSDLVAKAPDFASAHTSLLNSRILPGAEKDWQDHLDQISAKLNTAPTDAPTRADLAAQLDSLSAFPKNWPTPDSPALESARAAVVQHLALVTRLPDAPATIVDNLSLSGAGSDYQDYSVVLNITDLARLLSAHQTPFHVSAAPAATLALPPPNQWFNFTIQSGDFSPNDFLVLHDASRGAAGGRLLQFLVEAPNQIRLRWRVFAPTSDFYQKFPGNAPLRSLGQSLWLHFTGDFPLNSFYLLLFRPGDASPAFTPLRLPLAWLSTSGSPAQISLPGWLSQNLPLRVPPNEGFWLIPSSPRALDVVFSKPSAEVDKPAATLYDADWFASQLLQENRTLQDTLAHAQETQNDLEKQALTSPTGSQPNRADIDAASQTVTTLQNTITQNSAAVQAAGLPDWPASAAPWKLVYGSNPHQLSPLIEFAPDATGPTP